MKKWHAVLKFSIVPAVLCAMASIASARTIVYVSNADSKDIYILELDRKDGSLSLLDKVQTGGTVMPLALSPDHRYLYASLRSPPYSVASYCIDSASGRLYPLSVTPLADNMANLATDKAGASCLPRRIPAIKYP